MAYDFMQNVPLTEKIKVKKVGNSGFKKFCNVLAFIFGGLTAGLSEILLGVALCCTIIGIPFGLQHFKIAKIAFRPFGRNVVLRYGSHPVFNTLYLIFGGLETFIVQYLLRIVLALTIVGIPAAIVMGKYIPMNLGPFGSEVVLDGHTTKSRDTAYDMYMLFQRINVEPNKVVKTPEGFDATASSYIKYKAMANEDFRNVIKKSHTMKIVSIVFALICHLAILEVVYYLMNKYEINSYIFIAIALALIVILVLIYRSLLSNVSFKKYHKYLDFLYEYYGEDSKHCVGLQRNASKMEANQLYPNILREWVKEELKEEDKLPEDKIPQEN